MLNRWQSTIVDERGNVQPLANLTVRNEADQSLAKMWASPGTSQPLPDGMVQADGNGYAYFYAPAGLYRIQSNELSIDWRHVDVGAAVATMIAQQALDNALPTYGTLAEMQADTSQPVDTMARVVDDPAEGTNGFYLWDGAAWNRTSLQPASAEGVDAAITAAAEAQQSAIEAADSADSVQIKEQEREQIFEDAQEDRENRFNDFIASSGYQFLGDYSSGIEITEYNQIIRDADGEFWRLSGSTELPYTTTGAGLPEGDALAPLGDAVLRQNLDGDLENGLGSLLVRGSVIHTDSVEDLVSLDAAFLENGQRAQTPRGDYRWDSSTQQWRVVQGAFMSGYLPDWSAVNLMEKTNPVRFILGVVGNKLIGATSSGNLRESDDGEDWSEIIVNGLNIPMAINSDGAIFELEDGEVLISANSGTELWKSSGWKINTLTATWTKSVECESYATQVRFHPGWGIRVSRNYVIAAEYGNQGTASNVYLSTDTGQTFNKVFDQRVMFPNAGLGSTSHMHGCCVDTWHEEGPRLWVHSSDGPFSRLWYSDDLGASWDYMLDENYPAAVRVADPYEPDNSSDSTPPNYITLNPTEYGIVVGQDGLPDGTVVIPRDETYTNSPRAITASRIDWSVKGDLSALNYVAQSAVEVNGWVFVVHNPSANMVSGGVSQVPPLITATHPASQTGYTVWGGPLDRVSLSVIHHHNGVLWVRDVIKADMLKIPLYQSEGGRRIRSEHDTGDVLGGKIPSSRWRSLAVGRNVEVYADATIAIGDGIKANSANMLVIGGYNNADGVASVSISPGVAEYRADLDRSTVLGQGGVGIGHKHNVLANYSISIGFQSRAERASSVTIGRDAITNGQSAIAIGQNASAEVNFGVAIGISSKAEGTQSMAIGREAEATGQGGVALGYGAKANHSASVALGEGSTTNAASQVHIGNKHLKIGAVASNPASPVAGEVAIFYNQSLGKVYIQFPDGVNRAVAFEGA